MTAAVAAPLHELRDPNSLSVLTDAATRWRAGDLRAPEFAALYFLHWQIVLHGDQFASRKRKSDARPDRHEWLATLNRATAAERPLRLLDYLERYQFRGIIDNVPAALCAWLRGSWALVLREDIPAAIDVLRAQASGARPVTAITTYPRLLHPVLTKANAFAFFVHDLEHAYKFFHSPALYDGQRDFFQNLLAAIEQNVFVPYFSELTFAQKFDYLMSDMNTHPEHSRMYLRAILIEFHLRRENKLPTAALSPEAAQQMDNVMRAVA